MTLSYFNSIFLDPYPLFTTHKLDGTWNQAVNSFAPVENSAFQSYFELLHVQCSCFVLPAITTDIITGNKSFTIVQSIYFNICVNVSLLLIGVFWYWRKNLSYQQINKHLKQKNTIRYLFFSLVAFAIWYRHVYISHVYNQRKVCVALEIKSNKGTHLSDPKGG